MSSFHSIQLRASSREALSRMEIDTPAAIQERSIPPLLAGRDVMGQVQTGSGKTAVSGLHLMNRCDGQQRLALVRPQTAGEKKTSLNRGRPRLSRRRATA